MKRAVYSLILLVLVITLFANRVKIKNVYIEQTKESIPTAIDIGEIDIQMTDDNKEAPVEFNIDVPFMVQAPAANWELPYQEACEEAAIIMLYYFKQAKELNPTTADKEILDLVSWQESYFGYYKDTTIQETAEILQEYWDYEYEIINNPSIEDIKNQIALGRLVIAPFYGKALNNPYYSGDGPLYHMMVIKGYTENSFITNDPGTKRGEDYIYDYETIMSAMHDWNDGDVQNGSPKIIVLK